MTSAARDRGLMRVAGNTFVRFTGEVVAKLGSLVFFIALARSVGAEQYGAFSFALALTSALLIASGFGTDDLVARRVARSHGVAGSDLANVTALKSVLSILLLGVAVAVVVIGGYPAETIATTAVVGVAVALEVMAKSWFAVFQGHERLELVSACLILERAATAALGLIVLALGAGIVGAAAAYAAAAGLALVAAEVALRRYTPVRRTSPTRSQALEMLRFGVPIGIASLLVVVLLRVDVVLLSFLGDNEQVGFYSAGYRLVDALQFVTWSFGAAMLPWFARAAVGPRLGRIYMLALKLDAAVLMPIAIVLSCFAPTIMKLVYGDGYAGGAKPLAFLGLAVVAAGLQSLSATVLIARDSAGAVARSAAVVATQNIACNLVAIPLWGAVGAAAVALSSAILLAILNVRQARRRTGPFAVTRAFAGPAVAGAATAALALTLPVPAIPAAIVSVLVYGIVLAAIEWLWHRDDVRSYLRALPERLTALRPHARPVE
jgi:O-antigen/teichoic acid export membrane protein